MLHLLHEGEDGRQMRVPELQAYSTVGADSANRVESDVDT
jgi:hypothetical protein